MIRLRRPLCLAGAVYAAALTAAMFFSVRGAPAYEILDREQVTVAGYVDRKEHRLSQGKELQVISLTEAVVIKESQITILEQFLSDSEKIPRYRLHHFWKENRERLQKEDAAGIEGVLCYMDDTEAEDGELLLTGSLVMIQGEYRSFAHATNPGEFDAADYYRIMGQQGKIMKSRCIRESTAYHGFRESMYRLKEYLALLLDNCYDEQDASVMKAMLLGEKGTLDAQIKELYQQNGIIHILAISGVKMLSLVSPYP